MSINPRSAHDQLRFPHECYTMLLNTGPVAYNTSGEFWELFSYDDVRQMATDHKLFSSDSWKYATTEELAEEESRFESILNMDPPRHRQLRSLVSQAFTPRTIAGMAPRIAEISNELLDAVSDRETMDVIADFSYPLPVIVIAEMLGIPISDRALFKQWSDNLVSGEYEEYTSEGREAFIKRVRERVRQTTDEMFDYFREVIRQRRQRPGHDLVSSLLAADLDGSSLTERELLSFCTLLLVAGNITTTNLIGNVLLCFDEHPEVMARLRVEPNLIPQAIEEVLRYRPPVTVLGRWATRDLEIKGQHIPEGQFVLGWAASANYDANVFAHPETFDILRNPNPHLTFGHGIHFCLGAPLARLESKIALTIMLQRFSDMRRDRNADLTAVSSTFISGPKSLPITFNSGSGKHRPLLV